MKLFFSIMLFAICLLSLPSTSSGSGSPPGQVSFVVDNFDIAPAIAFVQKIAFVGQTYNLIPQVNIDRVMKGGGIIEQGFKTSLDVGYSNKDVVILKVPIYKLNCDFGFLLCPYAQVIFNPKTTAKNIRSAAPVTIRADSQRS